MFPVCVQTAAGPPLSFPPQAATRDRVAIKTAHCRVIDLIASSPPSSFLILNYFRVAGDVVFLRFITTIPPVPVIYSPSSAQNEPCGDQCRDQKRIFPIFFQALPVSCSSGSC
jgi:hypothetical protein